MAPTASLLPLDHLLYRGVAVTYVGAQALLALYTVHRYAMVALHARTKNDGAVPPAAPADWPAVTVQLPVRDEFYVIERLIDAAARLDYPRDRLEIQVLDDSTDETWRLAEEAAQRWRARGVNVRVLRRAHAVGFKAGALAAGLDRAQGELLAVFDADFVPRPDFLRRVVPHFADSRVGMVQARWGHLNRGFSSLTRAQSVFLDGHFLVEHGARSRSGLFFNFNGSAGVWRACCIREAGGWQHDTLTEDLDLSYRAQLAGWRFIYLPEVEAAAELPADMNALKSQQRRWVKGSIQTARKILPGLWRSPLPVRVKLEATYHLSCNVAYPLMLVSALLLLPLLARPAHVNGALVIAANLALFLAGTVAASVFFVAGQRAAGWSWAEALRGLPLAMALGAGLSLNNTRAVLGALRPRVGEWERTPKYALACRGERRARYRVGGRFSGVPELLLGAYVLATLLAAWRQGHWVALPFLALVAGGFAFVGWSSMRPAWGRARDVSPA